MDPLYLDYNATTPIAPEVIGIIMECLQADWGNASSSHVLGTSARRRIEKARQQVADMVGAEPSEIVFTSGGTEANHTIINSFSGNLFITTNLEHDSIRKTLENVQGVVKVVEANKNTCRVEVEDVLKLVRSECGQGHRTGLVTIMLANNETGVLQPVPEIGAAVREYNQANGTQFYMHSDAAQAIGKIQVNVKQLNADYLTIVGHKFYGPRIGAMYVRGLGHPNGAPLKPTFYGGGQERGYRAGTENTAMIAGLGKACELVTLNISSYEAHMRKVRDYLESRLSEEFPGLSFNGRTYQSERLPNTSSMSIHIDKVSGRDILVNCQSLIAGVGAACHSAASAGSVILLASGIESEKARTAIRLSVGRETTKCDIDKVVADLAQALHKSIT